MEGLSLLEEYRRRHGIKGICPVNEGVLFFNLKDMPEAIVLTSSFTKQVSICPKCPNNSDGVCLETFRFKPFPRCIQRVSHSHISPEDDLITHLQNAFPNGDDLIPHVCKSERDQEQWVWEFFLRGCPCRHEDRWRDFLKKHKDLTWLDQAYWVALNLPHLFEHFYQHVYSLCMINRKYTLRG